MDTDKLIQDLANEGQPVKRLRSPRKRFAIWLLVSFVYVVLGLIVLKIRGDCMAMLQDPGFLWQTGIALALGALAGYLAFVMSVPGREPKPVLRWSIVVLAAASLTTLISLSCITRGCSVGIGLGCSIGVAAFGLLPAVLLIIMLTRAAPLKSFICGALVGVAAIGLGATSMQFVCGSNDPLHLLLWHYLPGFLFVFIGIVIANRFFRV